MELFISSDVYVQNIETHTIFANKVLRKFFFILES